MEMGLGFLIGIFAGAMVAVIAALIIAFSRRALGKGAKQAREMEDVAAALQPESPIPGAGSATGTGGVRVTGHYTEKKGTADKKNTAPGMEARRGNTTHTMIVAEMDSRDKQLSKNIQEVRDLLLQLADVIATTESASGEAAEAFKSARDALGGSAEDTEAGLAKARSLLVEEIDRVLKSNAKLHAELDKANQGIAEQRRQIEELRVQARIDALTRIPNRASFDERLSEYISLLERTNLVFTLLLLDIDHFKRINDVYGHINGDRILRGVAARITDSIRNNDFAARYGGEEFAVIFPGTGAEEAIAVAERVRVDISRTNFRMDDENIKMTISGGMAECRKGMGPEQIIAAADAALYEAKRIGRNRMVKHGDNKTFVKEPPQGE